MYTMMHRKINLVHNILKFVDKRRTVCQKVWVSLLFDVESPEFVMSVVYTTLKVILVSVAFQEDVEWQYICEGEKDIKDQLSQIYNNIFDFLFIHYIS